MSAPQPASLFDQFAQGWRSYALIALIAFLSAQFGAGRMQVMDPEEARFAQATRQMVEAGDYAHVRLQTETQSARPIGVHWLQAAAVNAAEPLTHKRNAIWFYRLPSTLGLLLAAIATLWGGAALIGQRSALFGAALLSVAMLAGFQGMAATADALLLGFTTLALAALARLRAPQRKKVISLLFWFALACGVLIKGFIAPLAATLTLASLFAWERRAAWMKPLLWWPGPLLFAIVAALSLGTLFSFERGGLDQFTLPGFHLFLLPFLIFPATYALPAAARLSIETIRAPLADEDHAAFRFLICWALPILLVFELTPAKLPHFALPAYPAIALLCGAGLTAMTGRRWRTTHPAGVALFAVAGGVIVALMSIAATFMPGDFAADTRRAISTALIGVGIVAASFTALIMLRRPAARCAVLVACALALSFSFRERILPEARALNVSSEVVAALTRARLTPRDDRPLWVVGYSEPSLIFITRTDIRLAGPVEAGGEAQIGDAIVIEGRAMQDMTTQLATRDLQFTPAEEPVRGLTIANLDRVALFVGELRPISAAPPADVPR
ncbi:ArnT family glycosyltransferase [Terricaulis silvestris]|uniref:ArnT family glycosyltransferase n=1 Tax=Terricaulis silvestris TaxID=2686094 RepID=UPI00131CB7BB|nr:glycosyltransferase family 39 protein [Terricaulis silvestris]